MPSAERSLRALRRRPLFAAACVIALVAVVAPRIVEARAPKPIGGVTWVRGQGVFLGNENLIPFGNSSYDVKPERPLLPGQKIRMTQPHSDVHFYVRLGKRQAFCATKPRDGTVQVAPPGGGLLRFIAGR